MDKIIFRTPFNYDRDAVSLETGLVCEDESLTLQSHAEDADINVIVKRFGITGNFPQGLRAPTYGDFTYLGDYRDALDALRSADATFMALPAELRNKFGNDPAEFVDFCSNPANIKEMQEMGLVVPDLPPAGAEVSKVVPRGTAEVPDDKKE